MTALAEAVLRDYQVRKGRRRKRRFEAFLTQALAREGIALRAERAGLSRNLVIGDPDRAKLLITAHYDTCAVMPVPNFITPQNLVLYLAYQIALTALIVLLAWGGAAFLALLPGLRGLRPLFLGPLLLLFSGLLLFGPANRHTANDNTSGVVCVLETALALPAELRSKVAFVLFDHEELGLFGSAGFAAKHPAARRDAFVLNLDCVGDGDTVLLAFPRNCPPELCALLEASFLPDGEKEVELSRAGHTFYPSDQVSFRRGAAVAAFRRTRRGMLYLSRIHTARDTVFDVRNIVFIRGALLRAAARLV